MMKIWSILVLSGAMAAGVVGAAAAEEFSILDGIPAKGMSDAEMNAVVGQALTISTLSTSTIGGFTSLSLTDKVVADNGSAIIAGPIGIQFFHGGCPATTCGSGRLTGWKGDGKPLPRGFDLPPGH